MPSDVSSIAISFALLPLSRNLAARNWKCSSLVLIGVFNTQVKIKETGYIIVIKKRFDVLLDLLQLLFLFSLLFGRFRCGLALSLVRTFAWIPCIVNITKRRITVQGGNSSIH